MCIKQLFFVVPSFLCSVMWIVVCFLSIVVRVFVFYPLWCQSLLFIHCGASLCFLSIVVPVFAFLSIVVPVFVFYPLWYQSLCFSHCGASLSSNCEFWLPLSFVCKWETFIFYCIFHTKLFKILFWRQFMSTFSDLYLSTKAEKYVFCSSNSQIIFRSIFFKYSWFEHRFKSFCPQNLYHCIVFCT